MPEGSTDLLESAVQERAWRPARGRANARFARVRNLLASLNPRVKGAVAPAGLVVAAVVGVALLPTGRAVVGIDPAPSLSAPPPRPSPTPAAIFRMHELPAGRHAIEQVAGAVPFSLTVPKKRPKWAEGWADFGDVYLSLNSAGPQGAEALIYWTGLTASDDGAGAACSQWWGPPVGRTAADLATAASRSVGTELVAGPTDVTLGGRAAKRVVLTVRDDASCAPGLLYRRRAPRLGPFWSSTDVGDTVRIWIVDVDGALLYVEGDTHAHVDPAIGRQIQQIVESIRFARRYH
ncbi:MAG: hypothetical protein ACXV2I_12475 [Actinomycetes bacterium]